MKFYHITSIIHTRLLDISCYTLHILIILLILLILPILPIRSI